jgi:hypothetical protein
MRPDYVNALALRNLLDFQVLHKLLEALLIAVYIFPAIEVSDMSLTKEQTSSDF